MGKVARIGFGPLSDDGILSSRRNLWPHGADSPFCIVDSIQHSGRLWARWGCGVSPLLPDCPWFGQRLGIPHSTRSRPEADPIRPICGTLSSNCRNQADADRVGSEADRSSLKAVRARPAVSSTLVAALAALERLSGVPQVCEPASEAGRG